MKYIITKIRERKEGIMDIHAGVKIYQLLYYRIPSSEAEAQYAKDVKWFHKYEDAKKYLMEQEFDILNEHDLIEINEFTFNQWGYADYFKTILRGVKKGLNINMINLDELHKE